MPVSVGSSTYLIPGVYAITKVVNEAGSSLPAFNVGVMIGKQTKGIPYSAAVNDPNDFKGGDIMQPFSNTADLEKAQGAEAEGCELSTAMQYAKAVGAGTVFSMGVRPYTNLQSAAVPDKDVPANIMTFDSVDFGAHVNDTQIKVAANIHTVTPPAFTTFLTADAAAVDTVLKVQNAQNYSAGDSVFVTDNSTPPIAGTVDSVDTVGKTITLKAALGSALTQAKYARLFKVDMTKIVVSAALVTTVDIQAFYASNPGGLILKSVTGPITTVDATYLGSVTQTPAASPEATGADWTAIANNFSQWYQEFALKNGVYLRYILVVSADASVHATFVSLVNGMKAQNRPLVVVSGCALGDKDLQASSANFPLNRSFATNSDRFEMASFGLDGKDPYKTYASEIFGTHLATQVNHNLTRDPIVAQSVEKAFDKFDPVYSQYTAGGLMSIEITKNGYIMSQGINTFHNQSVVFDPQTQETYLMRNRNLADFDLMATMEVLDQFPGSDEVDETTVAAALKISGDIMRDQYKYISDYVINSITKAGTNWNVKRTVYLGSPDDFVVLENTLIAQ